MRKVAGIAFLLYCGLALVFIVAYGIGATQFNLPPGPPIVAAISAALAIAAVTTLARRRS